MSKDQIITQGTQRNLFEKEPTEEDQVKDFLKMIFRACEKVYSSEVVKEAFNEWEIQKEIEEEFERAAEEEIQEGDDF